MLVTVLSQCCRCAVMINLTTVGLVWSCLHWFSLGVDQLPNSFKLRSLLREKGLSQKKVMLEVEHISPQLTREVILDIVIIPVLFPQLLLCRLFYTNLPLYAHHVIKKRTRCALIGQDHRIYTLPSVGNSSNSSSSSNRLCSVFADFAVLLGLLMSSHEPIVKLMIWGTAARTNANRTRFR